MIHDERSSEAGADRERLLIASVQDHMRSIIHVLVFISKMRHRHDGGDRLVVWRKRKTWCGGPHTGDIWDKSRNCECGGLPGADECLWLPLPIFIESRHERPWSDNPGMIQGVARGSEFDRPARDRTCRAGVRGRCGKRPGLSLPKWRLRRGIRGYRWRLSEERVR